MINVQALQERIDSSKIFWWSVAVLAGLAFRFLVLYVTDNFDFQSFYRVASLSAEGKNVYANYKYYNYGILFSMMCGYFYKTAQYLGGSMLAYKILHVGFLALCDFVIAKVAEKKAGTLWGILFFLNPISMIVDGYHTQFDNVALMFGVLGVICLEESCEREAFSLNDMLGVIFLSLSLVTKHFMYAFPVYIIFSTRIKTRKKILYAFIPPLIVLLHFVPYWSEGSQGIISNVFMYRSFGNFPLLAESFLRGSFFDAIPATNIYLFIFVSLMIVSAYVFRRENIFNLFLVYTMAVVSFSSGASGQQLVIPCLAMLLLFREKSLPYFSLIFLRLAGKQVMLTAEAWCLLAYLVYYHRRLREKN